MTNVKNDEYLKKLQAEYRKTIPVLQMTDDERKEAGKQFMQALEKLQKAMEGEAERVGWKSEEDVVEYCKMIRREMGIKRGYIH
jgi:hypothetical protein